MVEQRRTEARLAPCRHHEVQIVADVGTADERSRPVLHHERRQAEDAITFPDRCQIQSRVDGKRSPPNREPYRQHEDRIPFQTHARIGPQGSSAFEAFWRDGPGGLCRSKHVIVSRKSSVSALTIWNSGDTAARQQEPRLRGYPESSRSRERPRTRGRPRRTLSAWRARGRSHLSRCSRARCPESGCEPLLPQSRRGHRLPRLPGSGT